MVDQAEIHRKCISDNVEDRREAVDRLRTNFTDLPEKEAAWKDLIRLAGDKNRPQPPVCTVWGGRLKNLIRLTGDENSFVRWMAADALGAAFAAVPDKESAWKDLIRLTGDEDSSVRVSANHSLGRASIFRATETENEEEFRKELENALQYFERSAAEATYSNPAKFCLPFYRSFYSLTCKSEVSEGEVEKYLKEAKDASEGSRSKEDLLEAVENLSNALKETQRL